jgi:hypothetical protein
MLGRTCWKFARALNLFEHVDYHSTPRRLGGGRRILRRQILIPTPLMGDMA